MAEFRLRKTLERERVFPKGVALMASGVGLAAGIDGILQSIYFSNPSYWTGKFPFIGVLDGKLPPLDDWMVAGIPAVMLAAGTLTMNPILAYLGLGGVLYGIGELMHETIVRNLPPALSAWAAGAGKVMTEMACLEKVAAPAPKYTPPATPATKTELY